MVAPEGEAAQEERAELTAFSAIAYGVGRGWNGSRQETPVQATSLTLRVTRTIP
jgi:hypothetical protein